MATAKINNRRDILLLLLFSPGKTGKINEPIVGRTRFVKMLFLFKQEALKSFQSGTEIDEKNFYEFFPWNFGPFSSQVYDDLTFFILRGFIESSATDEESLPESAAEWEEWQSLIGSRQPYEVNAYEEEAFTLTQKGQVFTNEMYAILSVAQKQMLIAFKSKLSDAPLRAILAYVYKTYPETTEKSKIKGDVLGRCS